MRLESGTHLGPYEILGLLGTGGMGEVYRARDARLGRDVAIKVLPETYSQDAERLRRFEQEARAAGMLNHPNILTIHDFGTHEGSPYVVSEVLEGKTLRQLQNGTALPPRKATDYALQIANGLAAAHEKRIVHRDLKPENLFITKDGRLKILDFGLAKLTHPTDSGSTNVTALTTETGPAVILGTVGYMSPEQVRAQPADHRSDIFSFGIILYEMLSGKIAFKRGTAIETMNAILKDDPPELSGSNPDISPALERVMRSCLEKDPEHRFQSARDLALALGAVSGTTASAAIPAPAAHRRISLHTVLYAAIALLPILAAAAFFAGRKSVKPVPVSAPAFHQLTFRRGTVGAARFAPDGNTVIYSAEWEGGTKQLFSTFRGSLESRSLGIPGANILSISSTNEMAIKLPGEILATVPIGGGAPRELQRDVAQADYAPDGKSMAVLHVVGEKRRIEYPLGKVLYEGAVAQPPRISPDGNLVAFAEFGDKTSINVVDRTGKRKIINNDFVSIRGLAWSPDGQEIWFRGSSATRDCICAVSLSGQLRTLLWMPSGSIRFLDDVSRDGRVLISQGDARCSINGLIAGDAKERDLSWFDGSVLADLSDDGKTMLFRETLGVDTDIIYLRKTDGSPAVRLGQGIPLGLSSDGQMVLSVLLTKSPPQLALLPTGAGQQTLIRNDAKYNYERAHWLPDGKRILFTASEPGHQTRLYIQNVNEGKAIPLTPEGVSTIEDTKPVSPDGKWVFAAKEGDVFLYPLEGGEPQPIRGMIPGDSPIQWTGDSRSLYVREESQFPARIFRLDLSTGRRELWTELVPSDPAGLWFVAPVIITPDGKSYVYSYWRELSDLLLVEGLQ